MTGGRQSEVIKLNSLSLNLKMKKPTKVKEELRKLAQKNPIAMVNMGILEEKEGNYKKAYEWWVKAKAAGLKNTVIDEWIQTKISFFGYRQK